VTNRRSGGSRSEPKASADRRSAIATQPIRPDVPLGAGFDVVADIHGCLDELEELLDRLGWRADGDRLAPWTPPGDRRLLIGGDLVDRGPRIPEVLTLAMAMIDAGVAYASVGNHDDKLRRALEGRPVKVTNGLEASLTQLDAEDAAFRATAHDFLASLPSHLLVDDDRLCVAHAGLPEDLQGHETRAARAFAMYGATETGTDEWGLPIRIDWAADYRGRALVVYGHTPVVEPIFRGNTIDIDTGCSFGHRLTALRYPERELVWVPARRVYQEKSGPFRIGGPGGRPIEPPGREGNGGADLHEPHRPMGHEASPPA
jgi:protein phosphatase